MAVAIKMPKMSDTMTEGVVRKWNFKLGDTVKSGDILAEVETDKATMDLENYEKGTILHFAINEGDAVPVDGIIAIVGKAGEDFHRYLAAQHLLHKPAKVKLKRLLLQKLKQRLLLQLRRLPLQTTMAVSLLLHWLRNWLLKKALTLLLLLVLAKMAVW